jgi:hypothetical protein
LEKRRRRSSSRLPRRNSCVVSSFHRGKPDWVSPPIPKAIPRELERCALCDLQHSSASCFRAGRAGRLSANAVGLPRCPFSLVHRRRGELHQPSDVERDLPWVFPRPHHGSLLPASRYHPPHSTICRNNRPQVKPSLTSGHLMLGDEGRDCVLVHNRVRAEVLGVGTAIGQGRGAALKPSLPGPPRMVRPNGYADPAIPSTSVPAPPAKAPMTPPSICANAYSYRCPSCQHPSPGKHSEREGRNP